MMTNAQLRSAAFQACCLAGIPQQESDSPNATFELNSLPVELRRATAVLMYSAIAYALSPPIGQNPRALRWAGQTWELTLWSEGRLHIAPVAGGVGLLSRSGSLF